MAILKNITHFSLRFIASISLATCLSACYEDFDPEIDTKPVLCLNSLITAGEPIVVEVSHTWIFNDNVAQRDHSVSDATITLIVNDNNVASDYIPMEGDKVKIVAESAKYGIATAEVTVPYATPIDKVAVTPVVTDFWKGADYLQYEMLADMLFNLNIEKDFNDQPEIANYFHFSYNKYIGKLNGGSNDDILAASHPDLFHIGYLEYDAEPIFKEHIGVFETIMGNDEDSEFNFFSDRQFSGSNYTLHLNFIRNSFSIKSKEYDESLLECGITLYLTTISQSYYNWAVYRWNVDEGIIGDLSDIGLAESKWGYSNVSTGAGIVAAQATSKYSIDLKNFLKTTLSEN